MTFNYLGKFGWNINSISVYCLLITIIVLILSGYIILSGIFLRYIKNERFIVKINFILCLLMGVIILIWKDVMIFGVIQFKFALIPGLLNFLAIIILHPYDIPKIKFLRNKRKLLRHGSIFSGYIFDVYGFRGKLRIKMEDLKRHILIYGQTGSGKSVFIKNFILQFVIKYPSIPFMIFEFKNEYEELKYKIDDLIIIKPGINYKLDIFDNDIFDSGVYIEVLYNTLKSCNILISENQEFSPQMEKVLVDCLKIVSENKSLHTWSDLYIQLKKYGIKKKDVIPQIEQTIISIGNRLRKYYSGSLKKLFIDKNDIRRNNHYLPISALLEKKCVIDLSSILKLGGSKEDLLFIANLFLKWIWEYRMQHPVSNEIHHLTIVEDSSYLVSQQLLQLSRIPTYLEDIALLLRGKGESLICSTTTLQISNNIIYNTGTKFFFKFNEKPSEVVPYLGINNPDEYEFKELKVGYCIAKLDSIPDPMLIKVPFSLRRLDLISSRIPSYKLPLKRYSRIEKDGNSNAIIQQSGKNRDNLFETAIKQDFLLIREKYRKCFNHSDNGINIKDVEELFFLIDKLIRKIGKSESLLNNSDGNVYDSALRHWLYFKTNYNTQNIHEWVYVIRTNNQLLRIIKIEFKKILDYLEKLIHF